MQKEACSKQKNSGSHEWMNLLQVTVDTTSGNPKARVDEHPIDMIATLLLDCIVMGVIRNTWKT